MNDDADWVEDVRRWYFAGVKAADASVDEAASTDFALGYEAAHPVLQARHWPDVPAGGFDRSVH